MRRGLAALDETTDVIRELSRWFDKKITDDDPVPKPIPLREHDYAQAPNSVSKVERVGSSENQRSGSIDLEDLSSELADGGKPEETQDMDIAIAAALRKPAREVVVTIEGLAVTRNDFVTLRGTTWLNDKIVDAYLSLIAKRSREDSILPKVYAFSLFHFQCYAAQGYDDVRSWTKSVDLFSYDILLVPVNENHHWCMTVVDLRLQQITYYDSLFNRNDIFLEMVQHYLQDEMMDKKNRRLNTEEWLLMHSENHPRQLNCNDCGVFALKFADYASQDLELYFSQEDMPYFRRRMMFEILRASLLPMA